MIRSRRRLILKALVGLVLVWLAAVALVLVMGRQSAERGIARVKRIRADSSLDHLLDPATGRELRRAERDLAQAERWSGSPILSPLLVLPVIGRQVGAARSLNHAAHQAVRISAETATALRGLAGKPAPKGEARVELVRQLNAVVRGAQQRLRAVASGSGVALIGPLDKAHRTFEDERAAALDGLRKADQLTTALGSFLQGPSSYLLVGANNAEMRAGSGMWLTAGTLSTNAGTLQLGEVRPTDDLVLPAGTVAVTDADLARNWSFLDPGRDFRQLALTPRFAVSAELAQRIWAAEPARIGGRVDGVVMVDVDGLRSLLRVVGPVTVGGVEYSAPNLRQRLLHDQYARFTGNQKARQDALGEVARAAFDKLEGGGWKAQDLIAQLSLAVQGRHLMAWSSKPVEQRGWEAASADGRLQASSVAVSLLNRGGNKLDPFVDQRVAVTTRRSGPDTAVTIRVDVANQSPPGLPAYVAGGPQVGAGLAPGEYGGILVVNVPAAASFLKVQGGSYTSLAGADGPTQARGVYLTVRSGAATTVTVTFVLLAAHGALVLEPTGRVPQANWTFNGRTYRAEYRRTVHW